MYPLYWEKYIYKSEKDKCVCAPSMGRGTYERERKVSVYVHPLLREKYKRERNECVCAPSLGETCIRVREI